VLISVSLDVPAGSFTSSGPFGSSPRSVLIKICANKKIGVKAKGEEDHPEVRPLPEYKKMRRLHQLGTCNLQKKTGTVERV